jgi:mannose-1-phosphate guanylyltransferase
MATRAKERSSAAGGALFAVILAGGRGTRFWPRSRRARPKQLLAFGGGESLLRATVARVAPLIPLSRVLVVTTRDLAGAIRRELPRLPRANLILEPDGRNTAPAIGLAALHALARDPAAMLLVLPSDHHVADGAAFCRAVVPAARFLRRNPGRLVTFGIRPTRVETGYGHIRVARAARARRGRAAASRRGAPLPVERFIEKPPLARARRLAREPGVFWNAGLFLWEARGYLDALARHRPAIARSLGRIRPLLARRGGAASVARIYSRIEAISVDYALLERERRRLFVVPLAIAWSDLGSWVSLGDVSRRDADGNLVEGTHVGIGTRRSILLAPGKVIATIGLSDLIVVDGGDVLFVCSAERAQEVRELVARVAARGLGRLL